MPDDVKTKSANPPEEDCGVCYKDDLKAIAPKEKPVRSFEGHRSKQFEPRFRRNDLVSVEQDVGRIPSVVLGYQDGKVVVQGVYTQERQNVAESRVIPLQEAN